MNRTTRCTNFLLCMESEERSDQKDLLYAILFCIFIRGCPHISNS